MFLRIRYLIVSLAVLAVLSSGCSRELPQVEVNVNGKGAVIVNAGTGEVLYAKNPEEKFPPASTTKVMTAILAVENLMLNEDITPTKKVLYVEPTVAGLKPGVSYKTKDLISAILIKSANDAAGALAEKISGSEKEFAFLMNEKAKRIGMRNTYFATASGLPTGKKDSQYTTAEDLAKMMRYASRYKIILRAMSRKDEVIYGSDGGRIYLKTHNKALLREKDAPWGKTGYTREARRTFCGVDPSMEPKIAFGLLKSNSLWSDIMTLKDKGLEIYKLSPKGFLVGIIDWVKGQRSDGKTSHSSLLENKK